MNKVHFKQLAMIGACIFSLGVFAVNASAANFKNLSLQGDFHEFHPAVLRVHAPFIKQVESDLNGVVTMNYFGGNTLYPESESFEAVNDGRVDFGAFRASVFPGKMNLMTLVDIPGMAQNSIVGSLLATDLLVKFPEIVSELPENSVPFSAWASAAYQIHSNDPVRSLEDIKGMKLVVWDAMALELAQKIGANPIRIVATDTYLTLSKGMADGVLCPIAPVRSLKISDVTKYHLMVNLAVGSTNINIFEPLWDDFPADIKAYFTKEGGQKYALKIGQALESSAAEDIAWMKKLGHEFITLPANEQEKIMQSLEPFKVQWVEKAKKAGYKNAEEMLKYAEQRANFYQENFEKGLYGKY